MYFSTSLLILISVFLSLLIVPSLTLNQTCNPIIVGGIGGSGTRGVIAFLEEAGMKPPTRINKAHDIKISESDDSLFTVVQQVTSETKSLWYDPDELSKISLKMFQEILAEINALSTPEGGVKWGFKAPNTMFLVPLWAKAFPEMCFVHVVRDGRDMAYSQRTRQAGFLFTNLVGRSATPIPPMIQQALFWQKANLELFEKGTLYLKERYQMVKIEDLLDPHSRVQTSRNLLLNLGMGEILETTQFRDALRVFSISLGGTKGVQVELEETYGKWKDQSLSEIRKLESSMLRSLRIFGYPLTAYFPKANLAPS